jgi:hypothetical protein
VRALLVRPFCVRGFALRSRLPGRRRRDPRRPKAVVSRLLLHGPPRLGPLPRLHYRAQMAMLMVSDDDDQQVVCLGCLAASATSPVLFGDLSI